MNRLSDKQIIDKNKRKTKLDKKRRKPNNSIAIKTAGKFARHE